MEYGFNFTGQKIYESPSDSINYSLQGSKLWTFSSCKAFATTLDITEDIFFNLKGTMYFLHVPIKHFIKAFHFAGKNDNARNEKDSFKQNWHFH